MTPPPEQDDNKARLLWRHAIVAVVLVLWSADIIGTLVWGTPSNPFLHAVFLAVVGWVLGVEVGAIGHRRNGDDHE